MRILGLSFDYHDAAAALLVDGEIVAAAQEERFSRKKHDSGLPRNAIEFCLKQAGISAAEVDHVSYYERPLLKFERIVSASLRRLPRGAASLEDTLGSWLRGRRFDVRARIAEVVPIAANRLTQFAHHHSHAAAAFYCSPFEAATVVTLDGVGEYETASISLGRGGGIEQLSSVRLPHSLGLFYSAFTAYLGFEVNEGEYKVMGMAAFGEPALYQEIMRLFTLRADGSFRLDQELFEFLCPTDLPYRPKLIDRFGPARKPESPFDVRDADPAIAEESKRYADIAASVQKCTEEVILHVVGRAVERTGIRQMCLAGGVALNSLANGRIIRELGLPLYVHPAAGDSGGAIGAALLMHHQALGRPRTRPLSNPYLGRPSTDAETVAAIAASGFGKTETLPDDQALVGRTAELIAGGAVIGWFQGRSEWGPRALGCRSILADPTRDDMQRMVNERIKFREPFRPFAPSVPVDRAAVFFDMPAVSEATAPEYFMLAVHPVRAEMRSRLPAITHADGTARVQVVSPASNPLYHALLEAFGRKVGLPVLLNTSFNLRGEPIVDTPADALKTFAFSGLDAVVLGRRIVHKGLQL